MLHYLLNVQRQVDVRDETNLTTQTLAVLVGELQLYYEKKFGAEGKSRECTKIPDYLFRDYAAGGSLCYICVACYDKKQEYDWEGFDFSAVDPRPGDASHNTRAVQNVQLCVAIQKVLVAKSFWKVPIVFFEKYKPTQKTEKFAEIVTSHGGCVTYNRSESTHIVILADPSKETPVVTQDYLRTIDIENARARVHWWYYPDSYDQWLDLNEIQGAPDPPVRPKRAWRVTQRFLIDMVKFNEWMNALDYEEDDVEDPNAALADGDEDTLAAMDWKEAGDAPDSKDDTDEDEAIAPAIIANSIRTKKRKVEGSLSSSAKPVKLSKHWAKRPKIVPQAASVAAAGDTDSQLISGPRNWALANPKGSTWGLAPVSEDVNMEWETDGLIWSNISNGQRPDDSYFPHSAGLFDRWVSSTEAAKLRPRPKFIPKRIAAAWYDPEDISAQEVRWLPEILRRQSKKKAASYRRLRNFLVDQYAARPYRRLTLQESLDMVDGDKYVTARVHQFLEQWGLINADIFTAHQPILPGDLSKSYPVLCPTDSRLMRLHDYADFNAGKSETPMGRPTSAKARPTNGTAAASGDGKTQEGQGAGAKREKTDGGERTIADGKQDGKQAQSAKGMDVVKQEKEDAGGDGGKAASASSSGGVKQEATEQDVKEREQKSNRRSRLLIFDDSDPPRGARQERQERQELFLGPSLVQSGVDPLYNPADGSDSNQPVVFRCQATGKRCDDIRFSLRQDRSWFICPEAFYNGEYPSFLSERDFVMETAQGELRLPDEPSNVSARKIKLLGASRELEMLRGFADPKMDIEEIAEAAEMPNKEKALTQFLRVPLVDRFVEHLDAMDATPTGKATADKTAAKKEQGKAESSDAKQPAEKDSQTLEVQSKETSQSDGQANDEANSHSNDQSETLPFMTTAANPIMAQLGVVASGISPHIASAMAKEALQLIGELESQATSTPRDASSPTNAENDQRPAAGIASVLNREQTARIVRAMYAKGAAKARELAEDEERQVRIILITAINHIMQRIDSKLDQYKKLDQWLKTEHGAVQRYKTQLVSEIGKLKPAS